MLDTKIKQALNAGLAHAEIKVEGTTLKMTWRTIVFTQPRTPEHGDFTSIGRFIDTVTNILRTKGVEPAKMKVESHLSSANETFRIWFEELRKF